MEPISLTSKVLHRLGSFVIGTPESLAMDEDFYFDVGDRVQPMPQDIRKRDVLADKIMTNVYRLGLTYRIGPILSGMCFVAVLALSAVSVTLTDWGKGIKTSYDQHVTAVAQEKQADATKALGDITQANCAAQVDDINAFSKQKKPGKEWSPDQTALMNFAGNCAAQEFLAMSGNPVQYHARKFSTAALGVVGQQTCSARLADFNALTAKNNWRYSIDPDDSALGAFMTNCQLRGFIHTADMNAPHPTFN